MQQQQQRQQLTSLDAKAKLSQKQIFQLLRQKLYGASASSPLAVPDDVSQGKLEGGGGGKEGGPPSSAAMKEAAPTGGVGDCASMMPSTSSAPANSPQCWLCASLKPPFINEQLQLVYSLPLSAATPATMAKTPSPATNTVVPSSAQCGMNSVPDPHLSHPHVILPSFTVAPSKASRLNRQTLSTLLPPLTEKEREWDDCLAEVSSSEYVYTKAPSAAAADSTSSTTPPPTASSSHPSSASSRPSPSPPRYPPLDLASMLLCLSCFKLCYEGFSRPALLNDASAMARRSQLSARVHRLAVMVAGKEGANEATSAGDEGNRTAAAKTAASDSNANALVPANAVAQTVAEGKAVKGSSADAASPLFSRSSCNSAAADDGRLGTEDLFPVLATSSATYVAGEGSSKGAVVGVVGGGGSADLGASNSVTAAIQSLSESRASRNVRNRGRDGEDNTEEKKVRPVAGLRSISEEEGGWEAVDHEDAEVASGEKEEDRFSGTRIDLLDATNNLFINTQGNFLLAVDEVPGDHDSAGGSPLVPLPPSSSAQPPNEHQKKSPFSPLLLEAPLIVGNAEGGAGGGNHQLYSSQSNRSPLVNKSPIVFGNRSAGTICSTTAAIVSGTVVGSPSSFPSPASLSRLRPPSSHQASLTSSLPPSHSMRGSSAKATTPHSNTEESVVTAAVVREGRVAVDKGAGVVVGTVVQARDASTVVPGTVLAPPLPPTATTAIHQATLVSRSVRVEDENANQSNTAASRRTGKAYNGPTDCLFCGEAILNRDGTVKVSTTTKRKPSTPSSMLRGAKLSTTTPSSGANALLSQGIPSYCIAFHPNPYFHRVWRCAHCTTIMTVALPQCLVCRADAPKFDEKMVTGVVEGAKTVKSEKKKKKRVVREQKKRADGAGFHFDPATCKVDSEGFPIIETDLLEDVVIFETETEEEDGDTNMFGWANNDNAEDGADATNTNHNPTRAIDELLLNIGAERQTQQGDGNCLFRSLAHQLFGADCHALVREMCCDFIACHHEDYAPLVIAMGLGAGVGGTSQPSSFTNRGSSANGNKEGKEEEVDIFAQYVARMRMSGTWGDELCVHAAARFFTVRIHILTSDYPHSRWHLVFQPDPIIVAPSHDGLMASNKDEAKNAGKATNAENSSAPLPRPPLDTRRMFKEYDDCCSAVVATAANDDGAKKKDATEAANSAVTDIFLLYLRPVHYDDIVSPPMVKSVMASLAETLQRELSTEEEWAE